ncbi:TonB-dependent receptor [Sphingosinicellaceae bacterium]|nr:TonB-dependent receptor [Sphingosinicellaceae bacterium]
MRQSFSRRAQLMTGVALFATALAVAPVAAQTLPATNDPGSVPAGTPTAPARSSVVTAQAGGLEDIVVTARRKVESAQDIPVSVTAISAAQIQAKDLTSLEKIAASTPQFTVGRASNGAGAQLTLRGIGSSATSIGVEQSVAIVVDGVYYGQGRVINEGFFDLARVEILKGPQALFFGKNATAGVVSLTTADPGDKAEYIGRVGYEFGSQQLSGEAIVSTPLTDTLGIRVAVRASNMFGGYYKNEAIDTPYSTFDVATGSLNAHTGLPATKDEPQEKELIGRVTLKWDPTDRLSVTLKGSVDYNHVDGNGWNYVAVNCPGGKTAIAPNYTCENHFVIHQNNLPVDIAAVYPYAKKDGALYNTYKSYQGTGTINYKLDNVTLTSITNYNHNDNRFACDCDFLSGAVWATENSSFHAFSEEFRAQTDFDSPINLMVGGYYQNTRRDFFQAVMFAGVENSAATPANRYVAYSKQSYTNGETLSGFGQVSWKILPKVEATAGVRYIHETKDSAFFQPYVNPAIASIFTPESAPSGILAAKQVFNNWSPEATISYKPVRDVLIYGAYKTAYKSGGFSNSAINSAQSPNPVGDLTFRPEKGAGFEGGVKTTLLDNQLRLNVGIYTYKYSNLQVDYFNSQIFAYQTYNAGTARTKGVEIEAEYAPQSIEGLSIHGTVNYNRARYKDFLAPCYSGQLPSAGCTLVGPSNAPFQSLSGQPTAVAPEWTGTLGFSYERPVSATLKFGINVDGRYSDNYTASSFGNPATGVHSYAVLDTSVRVGRDDGRWELALIAKNLTDHFYFTGGGDAPLTGSGTGTPSGIGADQTGYGTLPRTVKLQLTVKY